ncbi:hypothetical protein PanWU01x14_322030 [Parasponia andersonii]|uniref:Uncharacterized protein n=1 Tax=Parasponia andersonii TaxID=3476 RepID=A0A2P5AL10_PARAD|nr:hypothetical protein PanWU01x14_322030 [Parasponia andersonii]
MMGLLLKDLLAWALLEVNLRRLHLQNMLCFVTKQINDYSVDRQIDAVCLELSDVLPVDDESRNDENKVSRDDFSNVISSPAMFHLITSSRILVAASSSESTKAVEGKAGSEAHVQEVLVSGDADKAELEVKVTGESYLLGKTILEFRKSLQVLF